MKLICILKNVVKGLPVAALIFGMAACSDDKEEHLTGNRYSLTLTAGDGGSVSFVENEYTEGEEVTVTAIRNKRFITPCHCAGQTGENGDPKTWRKSLQ